MPILITALIAIAITLVIILLVKASKIKEFVQEVKEGAEFAEGAFKKMTEDPKVKETVNRVQENSNKMLEDIKKISSK